MTATKRCPRCGQVKAAEQFYRRRLGRRLSPYCQPCMRTAAREARKRHRQDPVAAAQLRAVDRARQRRRRALGGQGGEPMIAPPAPRRPAPGGGLAVLVVVTVLAALAGPHVTALRGLPAGGPGGIAWPEAPAAPATRTAAPGAARAVAFALAQRGKPYRWGAQGPHAYDCSGLTWAAWRAAGLAIPRTAAAQLAGLPRVRGRLRPGDLVIYTSRGPSRRHVAMVVGRGRLVEAPGRGIPVRSTSLRRGYLGAVRPGGGQ